MDTVKLITAKQFKALSEKSALPEQFAIVKACLDADIKQPDPNAPRVREFTISTSVVDRDKDTIAQEGWKLENYLKNPVVLFAHDHKGVPIGKALATFIDDGKLKSRAEFATKELSPFADMIFRMIEEKFLRAASVGFVPQKWSYNEDRKFGVDFVEQELLEWSVVPVPSNPEALAGVKANGIDTLPLKEWAERILDEWEKSEAGLYLKRPDVEAICKLSDPKVRSMILMATNEDLGKAAISYASAHADGTPKAPKDAEWDGPAEVAAAEVADLKVMSAWKSDEGEDTKSSYKLPHHKAAGDHAVVWHGVTAAMGALLGARGGADIPDADRKGVYSHLKKHYEEFDTEAPEFRFAEMQTLKRMPDIFRFNETTGELFVADKSDECAEAVERTAKEAAEMFKDGRVLSRANEQKLREAFAALNKVLSQLEAPADDDKHKGSAQTDDSVKTEREISELKGWIKESVQAEITALTGKVY